MHSLASLLTVHIHTYIYTHLQGRTDVVALLDEFAYRFYEELDYVKEVCLQDRILHVLAH
jgi:hypothetical protein